MKTEKSISHSEFLENVYQSLDDHIMQHTGRSMIKGFWQAGTPMQLIPNQSEYAKTLRSKGFWDAQVSTVYGNMGLLTAILGGNVRIGILLPKTLSEKQPDMMRSISCLYDGKPANAERDVGVMHFVDWVFHEAPFSSDWLLKCSYDEVARDVFKNHFLWLVVHLWEGFSRAVSLSHGDAIPILASSYVPPDIAEQCGLTIEDQFEYLSSDSVTYKVTLVRTLSGDLDEKTVELLTHVLPGFRTSGL